MYKVKLNIGMRHMFYRKPLKMAEEVIFSFPKLPAEIFRDAKGE